MKVTISLAALALVAGMAHAQDAPFGTDKDADYAAHGPKCRNLAWSATTCCGLSHMRVWNHTA